MSQSPSGARNFNSEMKVNFPLKLAVSSLDEWMSAFQDPCSTGKLSTAFLNCKHSTYSAKMIITQQSIDVPHVTWKVETNSGTHQQPSTSRHKKNAGSSEEPVTVRGWRLPRWCWGTVHIKLHLTCNIRESNTVYMFTIELQCGFWKPSIIITPWQHDTYFIRLQLEGTASRCGG